MAWKRLLLRVLPSLLSFAQIVLATQPAHSAEVIFF